MTNLTSKKPPLTERQFLDQVIDLAHACGWLVAHFRPGMVQKHGAVTWRTPVQADGKGFPDLVLVRPPRLIFAELKAEGRKVSPDQATWIILLRGVPGIETYLWRPGDWAEIQAILQDIPASRSR